MLIHSGARHTLTVPKVGDQLNNQRLAVVVSNEHGVDSCVVDLLTYRGVIKCLCYCSQVTTGTEIKELEWHMKHQRTDRTKGETAKTSKVYYFLSVEHRQTDYLNESNYYCFVYAIAIDFDQVV